MTLPIHTEPSLCKTKATHNYCNNGLQIKVKSLILPVQELNMHKTSVPGRRQPIFNSYIFHLPLAVLLY